jgi:hypothetical protein
MKNIMLALLLGGYVSTAIPAEFRVLSYNLTNETVNYLPPANCSSGWYPGDFQYAMSIAPWSISRRFLSPGLSDGSDGYCMINFTSELFPGENVIALFASKDTELPPAPPPIKFYGGCSWFRSMMHGCTGSNNINATTALSPWAGDEEMYVYFTFPYEATPPDGSYKKTCRMVTFDGSIKSTGILAAICEKNGSPETIKMLNYTARCAEKSTVSNLREKLECDTLKKPKGSYLDCDAPNWDDKKGIASAKSCGEGFQKTFNLELDVANKCKDGSDVNWAPGYAGHGKLVCDAPTVTEFRKNYP